MASPTFLDLFCGAGGLTVGLEDAGWNGLLGIDHWPDAIATYRRNISRHTALSMNIADVDLNILAKHLPVQPDWIVGGPPCQGWSTVGKRHWDDERNDLFTEFMRVVRLLRPQFFLIENVLGLRDMGAASAVKVLFSDLGYAVTVHTLRAADFGVPQLRRRVIFIGSRERLKARMPTKTYDEATYTTVWDAIGDLPAVGPGETVDRYDARPFTRYQRRMRGRARVLQGHTVSSHPPELVRAISFIPDGGNRTAIPAEYQPTSGFHNSYSRLASSEPAVAVTSNLGKPSATRCIHPFQHRGLTAREGARLQSFRDTFHFSGGIVSQRLQVANSVPPMLAEALGHALVDERAWTEDLREAPELAAA